MKRGCNSAAFLFASPPGRNTPGLVGARRAGECGENARYGTVPVTIYLNERFPRLNMLIEILEHMRWVEMAKDQDQHHDVMRERWSLIGYRDRKGLLGDDAGRTD